MLTVRQSDVVRDVLYLLDCSFWALWLTIAEFSVFGMGVGAGAWWFMDAGASTAMVDAFRGDMANGIGHVFPYVWIVNVVVWLLWSGLRELFWRE